MKRAEYTIISCSRRTDIPAFYYPWLQENLKRRFVLVQNPYSKETFQVVCPPKRYILSFCGQKISDMSSATRNICKTIACIFSSPSPATPDGWNKMSLIRKQRSGRWKRW